MAWCGKTRTMLRPLLLPCLLLALAGLVGCDGYPTEDRPTVDAFSMSHAQRLERLNHLGRSAHAVDRWRYSVERDCALAVNVRSKDATWNPQQVDLRKHTFKVAYRTEHALYGVQADSHTGTQPGVQLFTGKDRGTALEVTLLVKLLARDCQADTEDKASVSI